MQQQLINHSPDLLKLQEEGYLFEISGGLLVVHHIPYVTASKETRYGSLVCSLTLASPNRTGRPADHTMYFSGETPCHSDGTPLKEIINNSRRQQLSESIVVDHYFSSKPKSGNYLNYYDKVRTYSEILSAQAKVIDNKLTTKPNSKKAA
jgi:hypothetical protein